MSTEWIILDGTYSYQSKGGIVTIYRDGEEWLVNPPGSKAWATVAEELLETRNTARWLRRERDDEKRRADGNWDKVNQYAVERATMQARMDHLQAQIIDAEARLRTLEQRVKALEGEDETDDDAV